MTKEYDIEWNYLSSGEVDGNTGTSNYQTSLTVDGDVLYREYSWWGERSKTYRSLSNVRSSINHAMNCLNMSVSGYHCVSRLPTIEKELIDKRFKKDTRIASWCKDTSTLSYAGSSLVVDLTKYSETQEKLFAVQVAAMKLMRPEIKLTFSISYINERFPPKFSKFSSNDVL